MKRHVRVLAGWHRGKPGAPGWYERLYAADEDRPFVDYWDGQHWRLDEHGQKCVFQSRPWRPMNQSIVSGS